MNASARQPPRPLNAASGRVMQQLGMRREGTLRAAVRKDGRFADPALYALLAPVGTLASAAAIP